MSDIKEDKPYFAPPAEGEVPEGELPKWGEDAREIQRLAGLGSYGAEPKDEERAREETLLATLERMDGDLRKLRVSVNVLRIVTLLLGVSVAALGLAR